MKLNTSSYDNSTEGEIISDNNYEMNMTHTKFEVALLDRFNIEDMGLSIFVEINLLEKAIQEYYLINNNGADILKLNEKEFIAAKRVIGDKKMTKIYLMTLSVEAFNKLSVPGVKFELELL